MGKKQIDILALFGKRDEVEAKWTRTFNTVINSGMFGMTPNAKDVEAFINEAALAVQGCAHLGLALLRAQ